MPRGAKGHVLYKVILFPVTITRTNSVHDRDLCRPKVLKMTFGETFHMYKEILAQLNL
jgi:hypothetical protein